MGRFYTELECGCLISCDGGGGLMPCDNSDCKADEYLKEHEMVDGYCKICHPWYFKEKKMAYKKIKPVICPQCGHQFDIEYLEKVINAGLQLAELTVEMGEEISRKERHHKRSYTQ